MKRMLCIAALTALLALGLVPFAGALAEEGVVVDDVFKITFITAEFKDNWTEYTGERVTASATTNPHYGLRIYVLDPAASSSSDRLSERMRGWHLVDPDGNNYNTSTTKFYETDGKCRDLILIFKGEKPVAGGTPYAPEQLKLALGWGGETCPLDGVPQDEPAPGPEPTPAPTEPPADIQRLNALRAEYVARSGSYRTGDPVLRGKLLVVVYRDWDDQDPVLSCQDDWYVQGRIPAERLAASLDEADALVLIWPEYQSVGIYNTGAVATLCRTQVGVVDLTEDATYYPQTAAENDPPQTVQDREAHSGAYEPKTAVELAAEWLE